MSTCLHTTLFNSDNTQQYIERGETKKKHRLNFHTDRVPIVITLQQLVELLFINSFTIYTKPGGYDIIFLNMKLVFFFRVVVIKLLVYYSRLVGSGMFQTGTDIGQESMIELIKFSCTLCYLFIFFPLFFFCVHKNGNVTHEIGHELIICVFRLHQSCFFHRIVVYFPTFCCCCCCGIEKNPNSPKISN